MTCDPCANGKNPIDNFLNDREYRGHVIGGLLFIASIIYTVWVVWKFRSI
jgi:hypothetical protein